MTKKKYDIEEMLGASYNRITITGEIRETGKDREFTYVCVCGNTGKAKPSHLVNGNVKSCGCLHREKSIENLKQALLSPEIGKNSTHGMSGTRPHRIWVGMKTRCDNERAREYSDYGGRGISYCHKWKTFEGFWEDMKEGYSDDLTIDRVDTNGNYEKSNCQWSTYSEQAHHRRKRKGSSCVYVGVALSGIRFEANFCKDGIVKYLGVFDTEYEAAQAYDDAYEEVYRIRNNKTQRKL